MFRTWSIFIWNVYSWKVSVCIEVINYNYIALCYAVVFLILHFECAKILKWQNSVSMWNLIISTVLITTNAWKFDVQIGNSLVRNTLTTALVFVANHWIWFTVVYTTTPYTIYTIICMYIKHILYTSTYMCIDWELCFSVAYSNKYTYTIKQGAK